MSPIKPPRHLAHRTRKQIANDLQMSPRTLNRKLKVANIHLPKGLVSPQNQVRIYIALGCKAQLKPPEA